MAFQIHYRLNGPAPLDVAFEVRGFTALLGRSGAGKTTLLKALAGLLPATGTPWQGLPAELRPVGYMPQGSALFPHLSILENAAFGLRGPKRFEIAQKLLDDLGIGHLAKRGGAKVSGGEAQRAAMARALAREPQLLLLDEPSAALDPTTRDEVLAQLIDSIDARAIPTLAATHDQAVAALADWVVLLEAGRVIQQGRPRAVFEAPASVAAAKLLGFQNVWRENNATLAIRAQDIELGATGRAGVVLSVREQSRHVRLTCQMEAPAGAPMAEPMVVLLRHMQAQGFMPGLMVHLNFPPERLKRIG